MTSNKYNRDLNDVSKLLRPGRFDPRLFQHTPNAGDGIPGIQWMLHKILGMLLLPRFVIEGCYWNPATSTLSAGYIMYDGEIVKVDQTYILVHDDEWLYIKQDGSVWATTLESQATPHVMITQDIGGTPYDIRFRQTENILKLYNVDIRGNLDVDGISNLDNTDIDGTLDVSGQVDVHSNIEMNNTDLKDVKAMDGGGNAIIVNDNIDMVANSIIGTSVDISNAELQQLSNIGGAAISSAEWGYVASMQDVSTSSNPSFVTVESTQSTGTAPFTVASTTKVTNLNADTVDGVNVDSLTNTRLLRYNSTGTKIENATVTETAGALGGITTINMSGQLTNTVAGGTAPLVITSTTKVDNLNADKADGYDFDQALQQASSPTFAGLTMNGAIDMNSQDIDNIKDIDGKIFFVSTQSELTAAETAIGSGPGLIIITDLITITSTIAFNGSGSYRIMGMGYNTGFTSTINSTLLNFTSCDTLEMSNLRISHNPTSIITVSVDIAAGQTHYNIHHCQFFGNQNVQRAIRAGGEYHRIHHNYFTGAGTGIHLNGADFSILDANTFIDMDDKGIHISNTGDNNIISNNIFDDSTSNMWYGIYIEGCNKNTIVGNYCYGINTSTGAGICLTSGIYDSVITGNGIYFCGTNGIRMSQCYKCVCSGNIVNNTYANSSGTLAGISVYLGSECLLSGNIVVDGNNVGSGGMYGIHLDSGNDHSVIGNVCHGNESASLQDDATDTYSQVNRTVQ